MKDQQGKENLVAYFLFHVPKIDNSLIVEDQFIDKHMFIVTIKMPWYADVVNYLVAGKLPAHLSSRERKLIFQCSAQFTWIGGYIFHTGSHLQIRRYIIDDEIHDVLKARHDDPYGRHFAYHKIGHKVLYMGYY
jgi:hypothetical protein